MLTHVAIPSRCLPLNHLPLPLRAPLSLGLWARLYGHNLRRYHLGLRRIHVRVRSHNNLHRRVRATRFEKPLLGQRAYLRLHYRTPISRIETGQKRGTY